MVSLNFVESKRVFDEPTDHSILAASFFLTFKWVTFLDKFWLLNWAIWLNKPYNISTWGSLFLKSVEFNKCRWNFSFLDEKDSIKEISKSTGLRLGFPFHWFLLFYQLLMEDKKIENSHFPRFSFLISLKYFLNEVQTKASGIWCSKKEWKTFDLLES